MAIKEVVPWAPRMREYCLPKIFIILGGAFGKYGNNGASGWLERTGIGSDRCPWRYGGRSTVGKWEVVYNP